MKTETKKPNKKPVKIPESYEEYLLLSEKDKLKLLKQQQKKAQ
jgi:hypothetical protein